MERFTGLSNTNRHRQAITKNHLLWAEAKLDCVRNQPFVFMSKLVDSTDRGLVDYLHFGAVFVGFILTLAGIIATTPGLAALGLLILALGLAWFLVRN
jgi:hypothetical protein